MPLLSKSEIHYLHGQKEVSKSYGYKIKSTLKKKLSRLLNIDLSLLSSLFPNLDLTKFSKTKDRDKEQLDLTKSSKISYHSQAIQAIHDKELNVIPQNTL
jgi:hypothetical protein